ncbi:hypothetical protein N7456_011815 [Penicillium angulare]|uniref:Uncharacterized protein n=1 Tax=Penicillium angulare TaxID=116970 RepID=A0A9W9K030_9EURO|nr:hypothetical protein N7456_011815 [Penicillium angulare]
MPSITSIIFAAVLLAGFSHLAHAQTNITASACAASSVFSSCNRDVADKWSSCVNGCNGNGDCSVDCGCTAHQEYINCMAHSCWNQVYSCEYQLFIQQYFSICPGAIEPIPFWPAPDNAPGRCSCDLGKVLKNTLSARKEQVSCILNVTDQTVNTVTSSVSDSLSDISNIGSDIGNNVASIAETATECACCGASASISAAWEVCPHTIPTLAGADLWGIFFPSDYPNLYNSIPNFVWDTCDSDFDTGKCQDIGFVDPSDKFYKPGEFPSNGTSKLTNVDGTVSAPPSGTVITWSQSSTTWTVTATGYDEKAVASQSEYRATATGTDAFATQTSAGASSNAGCVVKPIGGLGSVGILGVMLMW